MTSVVLVPSVAGVALVTLVVAVTTIAPVPMIVRAILAGAKTVVLAVARWEDDSGVVVGGMALEVVRLWAPVRQSRGVRSRATRIWIKSVGVVVAS